LINSKILEKSFLFYKHKVFSKVSHIRGTSRLLQLVEKLAHSNLEKIDSKGTPVSDLEFDNLVIIDACRADLYDKVRGETKGKRISVGSATPEFLAKTFSKGDWSDVVYVSANPFLEEKRFENLTGRKPEEAFHCVYNVFESSWCGEYQTVKPEKVVEKAESARKLFPEKKLVVHFLQPHYPFIGDKELISSGIRVKSESFNQKNVWEAVESGDLDKKKVLEAYKSNLKYVLQYVDELSDSLDGRTVITSDHGNLIGERGFYGHPKGSSAKGLREVPYEVVSQ
jgi:hypothetical protein